MARLSLRDDFNGVFPQGPFSLYPRDRHEVLYRNKDQSFIIDDDLTAEERYNLSIKKPKVDLRHAQTVKPGLLEMGKNLMKTGAQAIANGKVSEEIRNERYETCKNCPFFIEDSKRCSECGCFMEAKTWIGGDPKQLCPKKKWER